MTARRACVLLALLLLGPGRPAGAQEPRPSPPSVFPAAVEVVTLDAVVLDRSGDPVRGLTRADFTIKEDGRPQDIVSFEAVEVPESAPSAAPTSRVSTNAGPRARPEQSFVIVFDDANLSPYSLPRVKKALGEFLSAGARDGDEVTIVPTAGGPWWTARLPQGREDLLAVVERLDAKRHTDSTPARISDYEAMQIVLGRDREVLAQVARRYFENRLIPEAYPQDRVARGDLDASPGLLLIRARAEQVYDQALVRLRASLDVLDRVAESLAGLRGRKTILLVSDGFIMDPGQTEFRDLTRAARNANAAVHLIDARGQEGPLGQAGLPGGGAEFGDAVEERDANALLTNASLESQGAVSVALDTGGEVVSGTARLAEGMQRVVGESRVYYLIGYSSTNAKRDGKFRRIETTVNRSGVDVRARRGYYAPSNKARPPRAGTGKLDARLRAALDAPFAAEGIPLRLTSHVFGPAASGKVSALLVGEADARAMAFKKSAAGRFETVLDSYVVVAARDGGEGARQEKVMELSLPPEVRASLEQAGVPILRELELPPGVYQARLLVRDRESGRIGTVRHEFTVEDPNRFHLSTPILTDQVQPGALPKPVPVARRRFRSGARLYCLFEVYGAAPDPSTRVPRVASGYVVRRPDGSPLTAMDRRALKPGPQGQLSQLLSLSLQGVAPGDYEIVLEVADEVAGRTVEVRERFTVES